MPASTIATDVRGILATALAGVTASVYSQPPNSVIPPACILVPDEPYLESQMLTSTGVRLKINLVITACVAYYDNAASLDNLELLLLQIYAVIPTGYEIGNVSRPTPMQVGSTSLLVADIQISTIYTQTT